MSTVYRLVVIKEHLLLTKAGKVSSRKVGAAFREHNTLPFYFWHKHGHFIAFAGPPWYRNSRRNATSLLEPAATRESPA